MFSLAHAVSHEQASVDSSPNLWAEFLRISNTSPDRKIYWRVFLRIVAHFKKYFPSSASVRFREIQKLK